MPTIRSELAQDLHVFYVTAQGYAADHWYGWFPKALNMHPEIFALLAHEGSRPKYMKERTRGQRPALIPFTEFLNDMGMTYQAIGDCYSYRAHMIQPVIERFGDEVPIVNFVRHPYVWLEFYVRWRASNMRMGSGATNPLDWEWETANHKLFELLRLEPYGKEDVDVWATLQGLWMLNQFALDHRSGVRHVRLEDVAADPERFRELVDFLTKGRCAFSDALLDQAYAMVDTPFRGEERLRMVPRKLREAWPEWKAFAFDKLVEAETRAVFEALGYRLW